MVLGGSPSALDRHFKISVFRATKCSCCHTTSASRVNGFGCGLTGSRGFYRLSLALGVCHGLLVSSFVFGLI